MRALLIGTLVGFSLVACDDPSPNSDSADGAAPDAAVSRDSGAADALVPGPDGALPGDSDGDGVPDSRDSCPGVANGDQSDRDGDHVGDVCDANPDRLDYQLKSAFLAFVGGHAVGPSQDLRGTARAVGGAVENSEHRLEGKSSP